MEIMLVRTPQAIHRIPCDLENNLLNDYDQQLNKIKASSNDAEVEVPKAPGA
jgi:hypothetical protein